MKATRIDARLHPNFEFSAEDKPMNRRTFLKTTGAVAATYPVTDRTRVGRNPDIQHVVLVMMENRSFDHLFGWLPNADGKQAGLHFPNKTGGKQRHPRTGAGLYRVRLSDPDHSYSGGRTEVNGGKMNGFLNACVQRLNAIGYYRERDLPFRSALARHYTTCDRLFSIYPRPYLSEPDLSERWSYGSSG